MLTYEIYMITIPHESQRFCKGRNAILLMEFY